MPGKKNNYNVAIIMGSQSDYVTMKYCKKVLNILKIKSELKIISAHRTLSECINLLNQLKKIIFP